MLRNSLLALFSLLAALPGTTPAQQPETAAALERTVLLPTQYPTSMILIPAGSFPRGMESEEFDEKPVRQIYLDDYLIDKYEVTVAQWGEYQQSTGTEIPEWTVQNSANRQDHPIAFVTWFDAEAFCTWAGKRLPTEAEWERAARCDDGRKYPWGDGLDSFRTNYFQSYDPFERSAGTILTTTPVGFFDGRLHEAYQTRSGASPFGVQDMVGNLWEWVNDWYYPTYYIDAPDRNPKGPEEGVVKSARGGSYAVDASHIRPSYRARNDPKLKGPDQGFRCAGDAPSTAVENRSWGALKRRYPVPVSP